MSKLTMRMLLDERQSLFDLQDKHPYYLTMEQLKRLQELSEIIEILAFNDGGPESETITPFQMEEVQRIRQLINKVKYSPILSCQKCRNGEKEAHVHSGKYKEKPND